jgi:hypothetical protein
MGCGCVYRIHMAWSRSHWCALVNTVINEECFFCIVTSCSSERDRRCSACRLRLLVSCLAYSSTLKMEAMCSSETSGPHRTTWHCDSEDRTLHINPSENFKSITVINVRVPQKRSNFAACQPTVFASRRILLHGVSFCIWMKQEL